MNLWSYHVGKEPSPLIQLAIDSAKKYHGDKFVLLDRASATDLGFGTLIDSCRKKKLPLWAEADLLRWAIIYNHGGAWTDTDVIHLRRLDMLRVVEDPPTFQFVGYNNRGKRKESIGVGIFAAPPKSDVVKFLFEYAWRKVQNAKPRQNKPYGYTGIEAAAKLVSNRQLYKQCKIFQPHRYQNILFPGAYKFLLEATDEQHAEGPSWCKQACCYHMTNVVYTHARVRALAREELLDSKTFLGFLLRQAYKVETANV